MRQERIENPEGILSLAPPQRNSQNSLCKTSTRPIRDAGMAIGGGVTPRRHALTRVGKPCATEHGEALVHESLGGT